ncbi:hypothetical protein GCM10027447_32100 [Glycomyces halotolerans]
MSTATIARRAAAFGIAAATATALTACGAGQVTQTDTKQTAIAGVNVDVGEDIALRDLQVEFPSPEGYEAGDDAPLKVWIANEGTETIRLTGVATEAASEVALVGGESSLPLEIAPGEYVRLDQTTDQHLALQGLSEDLLSGEAVEVTFQFSGEQTETVEVPVGPPTEPVEREYEEHPGLGH